MLGLSEVFDFLTHVYFRVSLPLSGSNKGNVLELYTQGVSRSVWPFQIEYNILKVRIISLRCISVVDWIRIDRSAACFWNASFVVGFYATSGFAWVNSVAQEKLNADMIFKGMGLDWCQKPVVMHIGFKSIAQANKLTSLDDLWKEFKCQCLWLFWKFHFSNV